MRKLSILCKGWILLGVTLMGLLFLLIASSLSQTSTSYQAVFQPLSTFTPMDMPEQEYDAPSKAMLDKFRVRS